MRFPRSKKFRHRIVSRKPPRNSGVTSNLGPFSCKRAQKMGRQGTSIANGKSECQNGCRTKHGRISRLCPRRKPAEPSIPPVPIAGRAPPTASSQCSCSSVPLAPAPDRAPQPGMRTGRLHGAPPAPIADRVPHRHRRPTELRRRRATTCCVASPSRRSAPAAHLLACRVCLRR